MRSLLEKTNLLKYYLMTSLYKGLTYISSFYKGLTYFSTIG